MEQHPSIIEDDAVLVQRAQRGHRRAFDELARRYRGSLLAVAVARLGDREAAEDVVQEALAQAWLKLPVLHETRAFAAWLTAITVNVSRRWWQRTVRQPVSLEGLAEVEQLPSAGPDPLEAVLAEELRRVWRQALLTISAENRRALVLQLWGQLSYDEIAQRLGVPLSTIEGRIYRAKGQLRRLLGAVASSDRPARVSQQGERAMYQQPTWMDSPRTLALFTRQLAALLDAGIAPTWAVRLLQQQAPAPYREVLKPLHAQLAAGNALSTALQAHPALFPPLYTRVLHIGERVHDPAAALATLTRLLESVVNAPKPLLTELQDLTPSLNLWLITHELSAFLTAGWSWVSIFYRLDYEQRWPFGEITCQELLTEMNHGGSLTTGMTRRPELYPPLFQAMVRAGEASGTLGETLVLLADLLQREWCNSRICDESSLLLPDAPALPDEWAALSERQQKFVLMLFCRALARLLPADALHYTATALLTSAALLPTDLREKVAGIAANGFTSKPAEALANLDFLPAFITDLLCIGERTDFLSLRLNTAADLLHDELYGDDMPALARFSTQFALLLEHGTPILLLLKELGHIAPPPYAAVTVDLSAALQNRQRLPVPMANHPALFPVPVREMVAMGEETGALDSAFRYIAKLCTFTELDSLPQPLALLLFTRMFATYINAGCSIMHTLRMLGEKALEPYTTAIPEISSRIAQGDTLSDAMRNMPELFSPLYLSLIHAGEVGGVLDLLLEQLTSMLEEELRLPRAAAMLLPGAPPLPNDLAQLRVPQRTLILQRFFRVFGTMLSADTPPLIALQVSADLLPSTQHDAIRAFSPAELANGLAEPLAKLHILPEFALQLMRIGEPTNRFGLLMSTVAELLVAPECSK